MDKAYWNSSKKQVNRVYKGVKSVQFLNNLLRSELAKAQDVINRLHYKGN